MLYDLDPDNVFTCPHCKQPAWKTTERMAHSLEGTFACTRCIMAAHSDGTAHILGKFSATVDCDNAHNLPAGHYRSTSRHMPLY